MLLTVSVVTSLYKQTGLSNLFLQVYSVLPLGLTISILGVLMVAGISYFYRNKTLEPITKAWNDFTEIIKEFIEAKQEIPASATDKLEQETKLRNDCFEKLRKFAGESISNNTADTLQNINTSPSDYRDLAQIAIVLVGVVNVVFGFPIGPSTAIVGYLL